MKTRVSLKYLVSYCRNSKTKCYKELHLSRSSGGISTGAARIFVRGGGKYDIIDPLYYHELQYKKLLYI